MTKDWELKEVSAMPSLRFTEMNLPCAAYPKENPLADFGRQSDAHAEMKRTPGMPDDVVVNPKFGTPVSLLPYLRQDDYSRCKKDAALPVAVLENDCLRATFVPSLGGRLWSLYDKIQQKELLHANPVFQPANLALRNAWFSGGIEWNVGIIGHTPFTCSPLFVETLEDPELGPVLRMYEYERIRQCIYQMDFFLPKGSSFLYGRFAIYNTQDKEIPMYWWTNMAVNEGKDVRVIVPADKALHLSYETGLAFRPFPYVLDTDASYSTNLNRAMDFFFYLEKNVRPYVAAVDGNGRGFVQTSTAELKGRKLFLWGMGEGGRRWQEYLAQPGSAYIEIQAGLGRSQMEYLPMPALSKYEWLEAFGPIEIDTSAAHGPWEAARAETDARLETVLPRATVDTLFKQTEKLSKTPGTPISGGSAWGLLHLARRQAGETVHMPDHLTFGCLSDEERDKAAPWFFLLETGRFGISDVKSPPKAYEVGRFWREKLEESVQTLDRDNPATYLHLGVIYYNDREFDKAKKAFETSLTLSPSPWALRGLAGLALYQEKDAERALMLYEQACRLAPDCRALAIEFGNAAFAKDKTAQFLAILTELSPSVVNDPRVRLIRARCLIHENRLVEGEELLLNLSEIADIREGEVILSDLWYQIREKERIAAGEEPGPELSARVRREYTLPKNLDFRMS
jgi:tetratricopeptide (TPR) repeat protein